MSQSMFLLLIALRVVPYTTYFKGALTMHLSRMNSDRSAG